MCLVHVVIVPHPALTKVGVCCPSVDCLFISIFLVVVDGYFIVVAALFPLCLSGLPVYILLPKYNVYCRCAVLGKPNNQTSHKANMHVENQDLCVCVMTRCGSVRGVSKICFQTSCLFCLCAANMIHRRDLLSVLMLKTMLTS